MHPDIEAFLELIEAADRPPMHRQPLAVARSAYESAARELAGPLAKDIQAQDLDFPTRDGGRIGMRLYSPDRSSSSALPCLLYFHGGGYTVGSIESHDGLCRALAGHASCAVISVAYRLAPEHKFPTACLDAEDAYLWLLEHGRGMGVDTRRIAVGGDSAGGTLATALARQATLADWPVPCAQVLLYPCTAPRPDTASHQRYARGHLLEAETLAWMYAHYLRSDADREDPRFAPLLAPSLRGLPPAFIGLARHDVLVDEGFAYAQRLLDDGVPTRLMVYEGMVHDFARLAAVVPEEADQVCRDVAYSLREAFAS